MRGLKDKIAIVTGAGRGIGRAVAERLLEEGARVLAVDNREELLNEWLPASGAAPLTCDVMDADGPDRIVAACLREFGAIDVLVNNAGVGNAPSLEETSDEQLDFFLDVNLRSTFRLCRSAMPELRRTRGAIINTASVIALSGFRKWASYAAAKGGVASLTRALAAEYGPVGVRVNAVAPGITATPGVAERLQTPQFKANILALVPMDRSAQPAELASVVAFLASADASFVTGQVIAVDGGHSSSSYISQEMVDLYVQAAGGR